MGFWHTGYMEFKEEFVYSPPSEAIPSPKPVRPLEPEAIRRPAMYIKEHEVGHQVFHITEPIDPNDIKVKYCNRMRLNGASITNQQLKETLATSRQFFANVELVGLKSTRTTISLDIQIADEQDLDEIDTTLSAMKNRHRLDLSAIDQFINDTKKCSSALPYCDGVVQYLYGVIAKERHHDCNIPFEDYQRYFKSSATKLASYNRPLARIITNLISFHFNQFSDVTQSMDKSRLSIAASIYEMWLNQIESAANLPRLKGAYPDQIEPSLTDFQTEDILRCTCWPDYRERYLSSISDKINDDTLADYDLYKLHILLAESYKDRGDVKRALKHVKQLAHLIAFEPWVRAMTAKLQKRSP